MDVVIIKYNAGNVESVRNALLRLGVHPEITADPSRIRSAGKVIFPGVGEAGTTMDYLRKHQLDKTILSLRQPVLGICLGLQLMCSYSEEGKTSCLGIFGERVTRFTPLQGRENIDKVPHMGWNSIYTLRSGIFETSMEGEFVYFVHSYYASGGKYTAAWCDYVVPFSAALQRDNFYATQFHPEKSGSVGENILKNFLKL